MDKNVEQSNAGDISVMPEHISVSVNVRQKSNTWLIGIQVQSILAAVQGTMYIPCPIMVLTLLTIVERIVSMRYN